jgi:hypothetical protein
MRSKIEMRNKVLEAGINTILVIQLQRIWLHYALELHGRWKLKAMKHLARETSQQQSIQAA